jgi:hypothetical protein
MSAVSGSIGSTIRKDKAKKATEKAKEIQAPSEQPRKKSIQDRVAGFILRGIERDRAARQTASKLVSQTGQTLRKAASVGSKAATEFAKGVKSGVETTADVAKKTKKAVVGEEYIGEKAESEQQQKLFGLALSVKRGETPRSEVSAEVLKIVDEMSEKEIRKYASTPHEGIPKKKEVTEAIVDLPTNSDNKTRETQSNTVDQQQKQKQQRLTRILQAKKNLQMAQQQAIRSGVSIADSYESEGEVVDEMSTSTKMSLEDYVMVKKDGSREIMPGNPPKAKLKNKTPNRTPEEEAAFRATQRKRLSKMSIQQMQDTRGT